LALRGGGGGKKRSAEQVRTGKGGGLADGSGEVKNEANAEKKKKVLYTVTEARKCRRRPQNRKKEKAKDGKCGVKTKERNDGGEKGMRLGFKVLEGIQGRRGT